MSKKIRLTEEMARTLHLLAKAKKPLETWGGNGTPGTFKALVKRGLAICVGKRPGADTYTITEEGAALSKQLLDEDPTGAPVTPAEQFPEVFQDGRRARADGKLTCLCPHRMDTPEREAWLAGWDDVEVASRKNHAIYIPSPKRAKKEGK